MKLCNTVLILDALYVSNPGGLVTPVKKIFRTYVLINHLKGLKIDLHELEVY